MRTLRTCLTILTQRAVPAFAFLVIVIAPLAAQETAPSGAQTGNAASGPALEEAGEDAPGPGLAGLRMINPRARIALPEPMPGPVLRFVVPDDFPPFAFVDGAGRLAGIHIDLIRAVCATLDLPCTLQARRFDRVIGAVREDPDNLVLAAGLSVSQSAAEDLRFSLPYYRFAARFVGLRDAEPVGLGTDWLAGAVIGVVGGTAHAAFVSDAFDNSDIVTFETPNALYRALRRGEVSHVFGDGVDLALWLASPMAADCCRFVGAPIFSLPYFGEGLAFAVPAGQPRLVQALNAALVRLESSGELETIMLTGFPVDPLGP